MVVCASGNKVQSITRELVSKCGCVFHDLLLVGLELSRLRLLQGHRERSDGVIVWSSLQTREDGSVNLLSNIPHDWIALLVHTSLTLPVEDHGASWATKGLVRGCCDDICIVKRAGNHVRCNKA